MTPELNKIIERAYKLFKPYQVSKPLDACTYCCLTEAQEDALVSMGVGYISFQLLYDYNTAAKTDKPPIHEFKHFLPRFFELTAAFQYPSHSTELGLQMHSM